MKTAADVPVFELGNAPCACHPRVASRIIEVFAPDESVSVAMALIERQNGALKLVTLESLRHAQPRVM